MDTRKKLTPTAITSAAKTLGVEEAAIRAVVEVESKQSGFLPSGHPVILYERHIMYRQLAKKFGTERAKREMNINRDLVNTKPGGYFKPMNEPDRLDRAALIDRECALMSCSWGLFQIMGFHWEYLGFANLQAFINAMYRSEDAQLAAFVEFVSRDVGMLTALRRKDWTQFASRYNGPNYAANKYDRKLADAYAKFVKLQTA